LYPYNNQYRNTVVSSRVRFAPDDRTDASLTYRWGDDTYHFPTNGTGQPVDSNQFSAERGPSLSVDAGRRFGAGLEVRGVAALRGGESAQPDARRACGRQLAVRRARHVPRGRLLPDRRDHARSRDGGHGVQGADVLRELCARLGARKPEPRSRALHELGSRPRA